MTEDDHTKRVAFAKIMQTSARMFGKKKLRSTWTGHPSHIREILLIKLSHLKDEYGEKKARALLMDALQRVGKRELGGKS